jgi:hypothetical protein
MTSSIQTFKEYLFQISNDTPVDPYEEEWNQFVDIENQKFEINFRELRVDEIFRKKSHPVSVDVLESIKENETLCDISTNKTINRTTNRITNRITNKTTNTYIYNTITTINTTNTTNRTNNIYIHNTDNMKHKYLHTEQPPSLVIDNRIYVVIILCTYVSIQFLIT